ncbi:MULTISPECIES: YfjL-like protein [unclassified Fredinandcohnia]|uniref:YfjL-like protein n=1 Tax=unclassified Fredinandcohnia TaxID=2837514 RepID=UPI0030FD7B74
MKKRKVIYGVIIGVLVVFVLFIYNAFNGNPVSKFYSTKVLEHYLEETYPERDFRMEEVFYNFKFSTYDFKVIEIGNASPNGNEPKTYEFTVRGFLKPYVNLDTIYIENLDEPLMEKLSGEAQSEITDLLMQSVPAVKGIGVSLEVLKGKYNSNTNWNKDMELERPISLHIVLDSTNSTVEDVFNEAEVIQKMLNENEYTYESVTINGNIIDNPNAEYVKDDTGYVKYSVSFEKDTEINVQNIEVFE